MKKEINTSFNIAATAVIWLIELLDSLATYEVGESTKSETLLDILGVSPIAQSFILFLMWIVIAIAFSLLFKEIWNRLLSDLFRLRQINFNESYVVSIVLAWVVLG